MLSYFSGQMVPGVLCVRDVPDSKFGKSNLPDIRYPAGYPLRHYPAVYRIVSAMPNLIFSCVLSTAPRYRFDGSDNQVAKW